MRKHRFNQTAKKSPGTWHPQQPQAEEEEQPEKDAENQSSPPPPKLMRISVNISIRGNSKKRKFHSFTRSLPGEDTQRNAEESGGKKLIDSTRYLAWPSSRETPPPGTQRKSGRALKETGIKLKLSSVILISHQVVQREGRGSEWDRWTYWIEEISLLNGGVNPRQSTRH